MPMSVLQGQLIVNQIGHELRRQPTLDLMANLSFGPTRLGFTQIHRQAAKILQDLTDTSRHTMQLLAQKRSRVLYYAEILFAVHQHLFTSGVHAGLIAAAGGESAQWQVS